MKRQGNKKKNKNKEWKQTFICPFAIWSIGLLYSISFFLLFPAVFQRDFYITQVKKVLSIQYKHHAEIT
jgi:hypothetical protein